MQSVMMESIARIESTNKKRIMSYLIFFGSLVITVGLWLASLDSYTFIWNDPFLFFSKLTVLPGIIAMCWTFILATRARLLEYMLGGLEHMYHLHKYVGITTFCLINAHVFFQIMRKFPHLQEIIRLFSPASGWGVFAGVGAFFLFIVLMTLTMSIRIPYHIWKRSHELFIIVLALSFLHIFLLNRHINSSLLLSIWIYTFIGIAFFSYIYIRFLYFYIGPKHICTVTRIERIRKTWNIYLEPTKKFSYFPGQFAYVSFDSDLLGKELHPYSFSSHPSQDFIRFSIKELGDYTQKISYLHVGDQATIWGPYGNFYEKYVFDAKRDAVFIAGGIGITPFLSMCGYEASNQTNRKTYIYYCVKESSRADFDTEIEGYAKKNPNIKLVTHCTTSFGFLRMDELKELPGGLTNKNFFICGPSAMMLVFAKQLRALGVKNRNIIMEQFDLLN